MPRRGRGDAAVQLPQYALAAQRAERTQRLYGGEVVLVGAFLRGVVLDGLVDHRGQLVDQRVHRAVGEEGRQLIEDVVVPLKAVLVGEQRRDQRPLARGRRVDGVVDRRCGAAARKAAEGQVVVPGQYGQPAVELIEIVVVQHIAQIAVVVDQQRVRRQPGDRAVHIQRRIERALRDRLEGRDQARFVRVRGVVGLGVVEYVSVERCVVAQIAQRRRALCAAAEAAVFVRRGEVGEIAVRQVGRGRRVGSAAVCLGACIGAVVGLVGRGRAVRSGFVVLRVVSHIEAVRRGHVAKIGHIRRGEIGKAVVLIAASAAAHAVRAIGLVEEAAVGREIALDEGIVDALDGQIQPPVFAVDIDLGHGEQRRFSARPVQQIVAQIFLDEGVVRLGVVEHLFVQPVERLLFDVFAEADLEAVALVLRHGQAGIALAADAGGGNALAV